MTDKHPIDCPKYSPAQNSRRCEHYKDSGQCTLTSNTYCTEWLKYNRHITPDGVHRDLLGDPVPEPKPKRRSPKKNGPLPETPKPLPVLTGFTKEAIESFKRLSAEICFECDLGRFWLVPEYTNRPRREITPEHLSTICHALMAFPGARVVSFDSAAEPKEKNNE